MEIVRKIIREQINLLFENKQLADKVYFNTGKLSPEDKEAIYDITHGDNFTKIISDIYWTYLQESFRDFISSKDLEEIEGFYIELKNYNKNVYPIAGLDIFKAKDIRLLIQVLKYRKQIISFIKKLPSIAFRNMKNDIRQERTVGELRKYKEDFEYFMSHFSYLANRDEELQKKVYQKMFKSSTELEDLMQFVDDKEAFLGGAEFSREDVKTMVDESYELMDIEFEWGDIMIVNVFDPAGIKKIGCNSLWCFTYGTGLQNAYQQWGQYSHNNQVYVIIDFREESDSPDFMYVLIRPLTNEEGELEDYSEGSAKEDDSPLFNMANENYYDPYPILKHQFGDSYEKVIYKHLNFED